MKGKGYFILGIALVILIVSVFKYSRSEPLNKNDYGVIESELICDEPYCTYSASIKNFTNEAQSIFFHIYGYKNEEGKALLVTEEREHIRIEANETVPVELKFSYSSKPDYIEHSIRSNKYSAWLGSCGDSIYLIDTNTLEIAVYLQMRIVDHPWQYSVRQGILVAKGDNYEVKFEDPKNNFTIEYGLSNFRQNITYPGGEGYLQACDIDMAKELILKAEAYLVAKKK